MRILQAMVLQSAEAETTDMRATAQEAAASKDVQVKGTAERQLGAGDIARGTGACPQPAADCTGVLTETRPAFLVNLPHQVTTTGDAAARRTKWVSPDIGFHQQLAVWHRSRRGLCPHLLLAQARLVHLAVQTRCRCRPLLSASSCATGDAPCPDSCLQQGPQLWHRQQATHLVQVKACNRFTMNLQVHVASGTKPCGSHQQGAAT